MSKKEIVTNLIAVFLIILSYYLSTTYSKNIFYIGAFALSGSITNQIAIYMLFNRVPFLYGSGIIELKFEELKLSIKNLILNEFFTKERVENFLKDEEKKIDIKPIVEKFDFSSAFDALKNSVMESKFANLLGLIGGETALDGLKEPFTLKLKSAILKLVSSNEFQSELSNYINSSSFSQDLVDKIDSIVENRVNELTPIMVKEILQNLMKEYLGWLVVWGGVFGGIMGFISSLLI